MSHCFTVRILTSLKWQQKFLGLAREFDEHKKALSLDLQIYSSVTMTSVYADVREVKDTVKDIVAMLKTAFDVWKTPEECELFAFIEKSGGIDRVRQNEGLVEELLRRAGKSTEASGQSLKAHEMLEETRKSVEELMEANAMAFDNKFRLMKSELEEVKTVVHREGDRVIAELRSGPHEDIVDPVRSVTLLLTLKIDARIRTSIGSG